MRIHGDIWLANYFKEFSYSNSLQISWRVRHSRQFLLNTAECQRF